VYRGNLPHWEIPGSVYFITFNTTQVFNLSDAAKDITAASIRFHANNKYRLYAFVVMDTHVHIVLQPLEKSSGVFHTLAQIMHSIKSYSAHQIQSTLKEEQRRMPISVNSAA
jgi:putative transposase